ncbi:MAG: sterol desaturase family protein [Acidobacteria bacterium]|nr:sterol desaturase family protein [Acidobacteriota bacterium]
MVYAVWLAGLGLLFWILERIWPRRPRQPFFRQGLISDVAYVVLNAHVLGVAIGNLSIPLIAWLDGALAAWNLKSAVYLGVMSGQPFWLQAIVLLLTIDFAKWCIHNLLHRVPALWRFHQVHHSITDMDWVGDWRFHWMEIIVYRGLLYVPAAFFGFRGEVMFAVGVFDTLIGHFAHANLRWNIGALRYVLNSPEMHIWHHNHPETGPTNRNFGLSLAIWDWIFGTAYLPAHDPARLGFNGIETYPRQLPGQWIEPFRAVFRR